MAKSGKRRLPLKRRTNSEVSVREQRERQALAAKPRRRPLRRLFSWLGKPFAALAKMPLWRKPVFKPARWFFKILGYVLFVPYLVGSFKELRLVTWPTRRQSWRLTFAVLMFAVFFGVIIAVVDFGLDKLFRKVVLNS